MLRWISRVLIDFSNITYASLPPFVANGLHLTNTSLSPSINGFPILLTKQKAGCICTPLCTLAALLLQCPRENRGYLELLLLALQ